MTNEEILETAARNAAEIVKLEVEIDRLNKVLKLTSIECLAGGFCLGYPNRTGDMTLSKLDMEMLETAGKCIQRILNQQEAKP